MSFPAYWHGEGIRRNIAYTFSFCPYCGFDLRPKTYKEDVSYDDFETPCNNFGHRGE